MSLTSRSLPLLCATWLACATAQAAPPEGAEAKDPAGKTVRAEAPRVYRYLAAGTPSFSDRPPARGSYVVLRPGCYACSPDSNVNWHVTQLHHDKYVDEITHAARQYRVDPALVRAVIHAESGFNARARSHKGAQGLMQLMPATARALGVRNAMTPHENIRGGARYLAELLARFRHDVALATAAYNAGPGAVEKYAGVPPYAETRVYVQRVRILHQRYRSAQSMARQAPG